MDYRISFQQTRDCFEKYLRLTIYLHLDFQKIFLQTHEKGGRMGRVTLSKTGDGTVP